MERGSVRRHFLAGALISGLAVLDPCSALVESKPPAQPPSEPGSGNQKAPVDAAPGEPRARGAAREGDGLGSAPSFSLQDLHGMLVESRYGSRPVTVVHFWASWCVPCMREIPDLNRFAAEWEPKGAALFAVALQSGSVAEVRQLVRPYGIRHTVLMGDEALARGFGKIPSFPTTFIVDSRGRIVESHSGATPDTQRKIESTVRAMIAAAQKK